MRRTSFSIALLSTLALVACDDASTGDAGVSAPDAEISGTSLDGGSSERSEPDAERRILQPDADVDTDIGVWDATIVDATLDAATSDAAVDPCDIPRGDFYRATCGINDSHLLLQLQQISSEGHVDHFYSDARLHLFTDLDLEGDEGDYFVECIYTGDTFRVDGETLPNNRVANTEHSWPRSWGADEGSIREADLHHLFVVDSTVNSTRGSYLFGDTDCDDAGGGACMYFDPIGSALGAPDHVVYHPGRPGTNQDYAANVFEVRPERRGDIARAIFYFAMRYPEQSTDASFPLWTQSYLRRWHEQDPVDNRERLRNDGVQAFQGNRNPFIDHPEFVDRIVEF